MSQNKSDMTQKKLLIHSDSQEECQRQNFKGLVAQFLVSAAVMLIAASCGMPIGYSAVLLPQLKSTNSTMKIDEDIGSWIASVHSAATPLGALLSGVLMEKCGRKMVLQLSALPLVTGWLLIALAPNHALMVVGRLIAGISAGLCAAPGQVLIGETSEANVRGVFSSIPFASYSFGILLVYALGSLLSWRTVAALSTTLPLIAATCFFFLPESPAWLAKRGLDEQAKSALLWLRGGDVIKAKQELQELLSRSETTKDNPDTWRFLLQPQFVKPMLIINVFNIMQILSGTYLIVFYAVDILSGVGSSKDMFSAAVLTAGVRFLFTIVASVVLSFVGRRTLALFSGIGTAISALLLATFFDASYVGRIFVLLYVALNTVGFMILPGVLIGELFPMKMRGLAGGLTFTLFNFLLFVVTKCFPMLRASVGVRGVFYLFGGSSVVASAFLYFALPETKGKTLAQIEDHFKRRNSRTTEDA